MLTRRQFHATLFAGLTAALCLPGRRALGQAPSDDLWLNRLSFGATPASRGDLAALGREGWLAAQLAMSPDDPGLTARLVAARLTIGYEAGEDEAGHHWPALPEEARPLALLDAPAEQLVRLLDWETPMDYAERARPAQEVVAASLIRAVHAPAQLREVMTQFWHDHFNVNAQKDETTAALFPLYDKMMRANAFGSFRVLLGAVARSPAMLYYLNNADSIASPANENYARELLELHSLGAESYLNDRYSDWHQVPGADQGAAAGYLDLDVYEVARAFTGWSVGDGRWLAEGETAPRTGAFHYVARWHDPYQKRILGREFPPNRGPMEDGEEVLDMLARHPGTARLVCRKLARRFLADDPPQALVERMAAEFLARAEAPDQIARVLRLLVQSPEFDAPAQKIRRPFEFLAAFCRAAGAEVTDRSNNFQWTLARAGWQQHEFGPPTGHPDVIGAWTGASSLNRMVDLAVFGLEDWFGVAQVALDEVLPDETAKDFLQRRAGHLVPQEAEAAAAAILSAYEIDPDSRVADFAPEDRAGAARAVMAMAALTPAFVLR